MQQQTSSKSQRQILLILTAMIILTAVSAVSILWIKQQITRTAQNTQNLEKQLEESVRKLRYLDERIADAHQPQFLEGRIAGKLTASTEDQIVWVEERVVADGRQYMITQPSGAGARLAVLRPDAYPRP